MLHRVGSLTCSTYPYSMEVLFGRSSRAFDEGAPQEIDVRDKGAYSAAVRIPRRIPYSLAVLVGVQRVITMPYVVI